MVWRYCMPAMAVGVLISLAVGTSQAQSTVVYSPQSIDSTFGSFAVSSSNSLVSFDLPEPVRRWEQILSESHPEIAGKMTVKKLLAALKRIGLPVYHDQSAKDDECESETLLEIEVSPLSLYRRIDNALKVHNAVITLTNEQFSLISIDNASDTEFFCTMVYDISGLDAAPETIARVIRIALSPDSWDDVNGDGSLEFLRIHGRQLLVVSQTWPIQLSLRRLFAGLGSAVQMPVRANREYRQGGMVFSGGSVAVAVPVGRDRKSMRPIQRKTIPAPHSSGGVF